MEEGQVQLSFRKTLWVCDWTCQYLLSVSNKQPPYPHMMERPLGNWNLWGRPSIVFPTEHFSPCAITDRTQSSRLLLLLKGGTEESKTNSPPPKLHFSVQYLLVSPPSLYYLLAYSIAKKEECF